MRLAVSGGGGELVDVELNLNHINTGAEITYLGASGWITSDDVFFSPIRMQKGSIASIVSSNNIEGTFPSGYVEVIDYRNHDSYSLLMFIAVGDGAIGAQYSYGQVG